jgi:hypothetical protein
MAAANKTSEITPTARGGSKPNGAKGKPERLVKIVVARKTAFQPPESRWVIRPYNTTKPARIPIRLTATWI